MTAETEALEVPQHNLITFYDAIDVTEIPESALYAALYADGEFAPKSMQDIRRFTHRRWITVTGDNHHCGIADYEYPNPTFTVNGRLAQWAAARSNLYGVPPIVYSDMSDVHRAIRDLNGITVIWWIATRKRGQLTPDQIVTLLHDEFDTVIRPEDIWANQYEDVGGKYDVSNLFGKWYH